MSVSLLRQIPKQYKIKRRTEVRRNPAASMTTPHTINRMPANDVTKDQRGVVQLQEKRE